MCTYNIMYVVILVVYNAKDHNVLVQYCVHDSCNCSLIRIAYLKYRWPRSDKWYIHKLHKYYIPRTSVRIYCSFFFFFFVIKKLWYLSPPSSDCRETGTCRVVRRIQVLSPSTEFCITLREHCCVHKSTKDRLVCIIYV